MKTELANYLNAETERLKAQQLVERTQLSDADKNFIKDILKTIGNDDTLNEQFAVALGLTQSDFDQTADLIFRKLQNGRLTIAI